MRTPTTGIAVPVLATLLAASAPIASAQLDKLKDRTPEERAQAQTAFMKSALDLTTDQVPKVEAINLKYAQKMEPVIQGSGSQGEKLHQAIQINQEKEAELEQILSAEQFQKYQSFKEEMRKKFIQRASP